MTAGNENTAFCELQKIHENFLIAALNHEHNKRKTWEKLQRKNESALQKHFFQLLIVAILSTLFAFWNMFTLPLTFVNYSALIIILSLFLISFFSFFKRIKETKREKNELLKDDVKFYKNKADQFSGLLQDPQYVEFKQIINNILENISRLIKTDS